MKETPNTRRRKSSASVQATPSNGPVNISPEPCTLLIEALAPCMEKVVTSDSLDGSDVRHRAILGQIMSTLVEEMIANARTEHLIGEIFQSLARDYMDKLMDVTLVHFQPNAATIHPVIVNTLAALARNKPAQVTPFIKSLLSTSTQLMRNIKVSDMALRLSFANAISQFFEAILDYNSSQSSSSNRCITMDQFNPEADAIYECLFVSWLNSARDTDSKVSVLAAVSSTTPFLSSVLLKEKCSSYVLSILQMYKKFSVSLSSCLDITLCLSQLLEVASKSHPASLESILDPLFNTLFQQICIIPDYNKSSSVRNHNEILRCYDTMMRSSPVKLVNGLLNKVDNSEERSKCGALTVIRHLLSLPTEILGERLEDIFSNISGKLSEPSRHVQRLLVKIILMLGNHGAVRGDRGRDCVEFIIRLAGSGSCSEDTCLVDSSYVATESLAEMCANTLALLTTGVPSVGDLLWPGCLEYICTPDYDGSAGPLARSLASLAVTRGHEAVPWSHWSHATSPASLLARVLVLASVPHVQHRGGYLLRFLIKFSPNLGAGDRLDSLWEARFPLLLHYLDQHKDKVDLVQWQDWLLALALDTVHQVDTEEWTLDLVSALVNQLPLYSSEAREKSFSVVLTGQLLTRVTARQNVLDTLSSLFLVSIDRPPGEAESCSRAFGLCASTHLDLVMNKLEMLMRNQNRRNRTSFFGLLRDIKGEESQVRELSIIIKCLGRAATKAPPLQLSQHCSTMVSTFLSPLLQDCRESAVIRESVLESVSELAVALRHVLNEQPDFVLPLHEEMLQSAIQILQNASLPLTCRQKSLQCLTSLIELPPNISEVTRCSLLRACFSTIFSSFLEHETSKTEEYTIASHLEQQLGEMARKLHILIKELLRQDMAPSTLDEIFTMLEPWLKLDQDLSRELSVNIFRSALETYVKGVKLGVNSPSNFTPGPYMIGAMIPRCYDPSKRVRRLAIECLEQLLRILGLYEGLATENIEQSLVQIQTVNTRCNGEEGQARLETDLVTNALVGILGERVMHQHILSLLDSLVETLLDTQAGSVEGAIMVMNGLVISRGSEVFQNVTGFVRKLHDKMGVMKIDETADKVDLVAEIVRSFCVHNTRAVVSSLVNMELPPDSDTVLIWQSLAQDLRLAGEVVEVILEIISGDPETVTQAQCVSAATGLGLMLDTRRMEEVARSEIGRLVSSLALMLTRSLGQKFSVLGSQTSLSKVASSQKRSLDPASVSLTSLRSVFSSVGAVVVTGVLDSGSLGDYSQCAGLLARMMEAVCCHAAQHVSALVTSHVPHTRSTCPDSVRVAGVAVLSAAAEHGAGGDKSLFPLLHSTLLLSCSDGLPLVRRLALAGASSLAPHMEDTQTRASLSALVAGLEDSHCSTVSLTSLRGLAQLLPHLSPSQLQPLVSSLALKVRPYFESSSEDHRAAAINIYSCLDTSRGHESGDSGTRYLDYASTVLVPVLLHSTSPHAATREACLNTLETIARASKFKPLITSLASWPSEGDFSSLMSILISSR